MSIEHFVKIKRLTNRVNEFLTDYKKIDSVIKEYDNLQGTVTSFLNDSSLLKEDITYHLSNYLFRVRKYLDNWETHINRKYGKTSSFMNKFKDATSNEYDNHMEYRIMYQLRNFDQHCDSIVSSINIGLNQNSDKCLKVALSRDRLLNEYKKWKEIEKIDLRSLDNEIDALALVNEYHKCVLRIHKNILKYHMVRELYMDCAELLKYGNEYKEKREKLYFVVQEKVIDKSFWQQSTKSLNFKSWCVPQCYEILLQHIKQNMQLAKVLYCGKQYELLLKDAAIKVDNHVLISLSHNTFTQEKSGKKYIIGYVHVEFDNGMGWAILVDERLGEKEVRNITKDMESYVTAILKAQ